jgi:hypothetical protein
VAGVQPRLMLCSLRHPTIFLAFEPHGWTRSSLVHLDMSVRCGHPGESWRGLERAGESASIEQILDVAESMLWMVC